MVLVCSTAGAQSLSDASLSGKYFFVQLLADSPAGQPVAARNLGGSITFDGKGAYNYSGKLGVGAAAATAASGQGVYRVADGGSLTLTSPIRSTLEVRGWLGCAGNEASSWPGGCGDLLIIGASTEATDSSYDFFLAIHAPTGTATSALLSGTYTAASLRLADSGAASALLSLAANGNGQFTSLTVLGHATDQGGANASQSVSGATYALNADGTGSVSLGSTNALVSGDREIFISPDGAYLIGYSSAAGPRDVVVGVKNYSGSAAAANFEGDYRVAELTVETLAGAKTAFDGATFSAGSGTVRALGNGRALLSERLHVLNTRMDYSGVNSYQVSADGTGALAPKLTQDLKNMALGPAVNLGTLAGAQVGLAGKASYQYGVFFAARAPTIYARPHGPALPPPLFLNPNGVVNAASFAPVPAPVCPGAIVSLFGSAFAGDKAVATSLPLPTVLGGLTVTVGGTQAPLFYVSPGQVNMQIPFGLKGSSVSLKAGPGTATSSEVTVPLAATCPGVFFYDDGQSPFRGVVLHADYVLVTASKPARLGETVLIYLTGLGELSPAATTGAANPESPPGKALDPAIVVYFGGEAALGVAFAGGAPRFAGLNQINVTIPFSAPTGSSVPVAIATSTAYTDVVDIPISY